MDKVQLDQAVQEATQKKAEHLGHTLSKWVASSSGTEAVCRSCGRHVFVKPTENGTEVKGRAFRESCVTQTGRA